MTTQATHEHGELAALFWKSDEGKAALAGMRLDHHAILPTFVSRYHDFGSDAEIAAFYAPDGEYESIKRLIIEWWPKNGGA